MHVFYANTAQRHTQETTQKVMEYRRRKNRIKQIRRGLDIVLAFLLGATFVALIFLDHT